jgi:hypothetical protein
MGKFHTALMKSLFAKQRPVAPAETLAPNRSLGKDIGDNSQQPGRRPFVKNQKQTGTKVHHNP